MNLADVAQELYGLPPEEFTDVRNTRAKEITAAGDRDLGAEVRKLRKPTVAAWLANMLVRTCPARVEELIALGPELREAQTQGERAEMRRVLDRRREVISELVDTALQCATESGHSMGPPVQRQLEETLEAAVADAASASLLRSGTLSSPLAFIGFGVESATTQRRPARSEAEQSKKASSRERDSGGKTRATEWASAKAAAQSLSSAQRAMVKAKASVDEARQRNSDASARHRAATKELNDADRDRERAKKELEVALLNRAHAQEHLREAAREHNSRQGKPGIER